MLRWRCYQPAVAVRRSRRRPPASTTRLPIFRSSCLDPISCHSLFLSGGRCRRDLVRQFLRWRKGRNCLRSRPPPPLLSAVWLPNGYPFAGPKLIFLAGRADVVGVGWTAWLEASPCPEVLGSLVKRDTVPASPCTITCLVIFATLPTFPVCGSALTVLILPDRDTNHCDTAYCYRCRTQHGISVCLSVCLSVYVLVTQLCCEKKRLNRSRCLRVGDWLLWYKEPFIGWGQDGTNPFAAARRDKSAMQPFAKLLCTRVFIVNIDFEMDSDLKSGDLVVLALKWLESLHRCCNLEWPSAVLAIRFWCNQLLHVRDGRHMSLPENTQDICLPTTVALPDLRPFGQAPHLILYCVYILRHILFVRGGTCPGEEQVYGELSTFLMLTVLYDWVSDIPPDNSPPGQFPLTQTINLTQLTLNLLTPLLTLTITEHGRRKYPRGELSRGELSVSHTIV